MQGITTFLKISMDYNKRMEESNDQEQSFLHPITFTGAKLPQPTAMAGIEVTSEELPDLYKNMTLNELKEAKLFE